MKIREWSPMIPGTQRSRLEFLVIVKRLSMSMGNPEVNDVREVADYQVLSMAQVARIASCRYSKVAGIYDAFDLPKIRTKGEFDHGAIDALLVVCKKRASNEPVPAELLQALTAHVTPKMLEMLTGTPISTYWYHHRKREGQS